MDFHFTHAENNKAFKAFVTVKIDGDEQDVIGNGNGRLDSVCNAMEKLGLKAHIASYSEHAMTGGSDSSAMAYVASRTRTAKLFGARASITTLLPHPSRPHFCPEPHVAPFGAGTYSPAPRWGGRARFLGTNASNAPRRIHRPSTLIYLLPLTILKGDSIWA